MARIISNILLVLSVFVLPVYISVFFILISIFLFDNFVEAILWAFVIDILYGGGGILGIHFVYFFTLIMLIAYIFSFKFKEVLRLSI